MTSEPRGPPLSIEEGITMTGSRTGSLLLALTVALGSSADGLAQEDVRGGEPDFPAEARASHSAARATCTLRATPPCGGSKRPAR